MRYIQIAFSYWHDTICFLERIDDSRPAKDIYTGLRLCVTYK